MFVSGVLQSSGSEMSSRAQVLSLHFAGICVGLIPRLVLHYFKVTFSVLGYLSPFRVHLLTPGPVTVAREIPFLFDLDCSQAQLVCIRIHDDQS